MTRTDRESINEGGLPSSEQTGFASLGSGLPGVHPL